MKLPPTRILALAALSLVAYSGTAFANPSVQVTTGNWSNTGTWSTGAVPLGSSGPGIGNNSTITFQEGDSYTGGGWTLGLLIGYDSWGSNWSLANPGSGTLNVTGGTMSTGYLGLGAGLDGGTQTGTLNISGGNVTADQDMLLGWSTTPGSSINVSGGTFNMAGAAASYNIGHAAAASLNISGNGVVNLSRSVAVKNGSVISISDTGSLYCGAGSNLQLAFAVGTGTINQSGGTATFATGESLWLGNAIGQDATYNLSGGTLTQTGYIRMGVWASGHGVINQTGGTYEMGSSVEVWGSEASSYNLKGGTFKVTAANAAFNVYSGGVSMSVTGTSGNVTLDTQAYNFTAPTGSSFNNPSATLTKIGSGAFRFYHGPFSVTNGTLDMQDGTLESDQSFTIGDGVGTAVANISGGTIKYGYPEAANFGAGVGAGSTGTINQTGGTVVSSDKNYWIGVSGGTGTHNLSGGSFTTGGSAYVGLWGGGTATLNINGGNFSVAGLTIGYESTGTVNLTSGTLSVASLDVLTGSLNAGSTLNVSGTLAIASGGVVNLNSGGALMTPNNVTINAGGTLKLGGGTISVNSGANFILNSGTYDINGQTVAAGSYEASPFWAPNAKLVNSSATAAVIDGAGPKNTVWINASGAIIETVGNLTIGSIVTDGGSNNGFTKTGNGTLFLTNPGNDYNGETIINEGTLSIANAVLADAADVRLATGATLNLNFDATDAIDEFFINNVKQANGTWGSTLSSATHKTSQITGGGTLTVGGTVTPTTPTITTAPTATAITVGQTLASSILSGGVASVPGTFAFTTPSTAPAVGTASQPVTFTPNDTVSYTTATTTASVTVYASYANAFGTNSPTAIGANGLANLVNYAFGANSPGAAVTLPASALTADALSLTATVRTNDPTVTTVGESGTNLVLWSPTIIPGLPTQDQTGATPGETQRQIFSAPRGTNSKLFLLLEAIQSN